MPRSIAIRRLLAGAGAYLLVLGFVLWPWVRVADRAVPSSIPIAWPDDARLHIAMIDAALRPQSPGGIFRAPIFHPAPDQLLGTEILASSLPLAAPFLAATGNATFAACGAALLTYPLAAVAMDALLLALGCVPLAAWVAGLLFALGPLRVPGNLQVLQYPNFWLPVVALSLTASRSRTRPRWAAGTALALALAGLSSLYMAVMVAICAAAWFLFEFVRGGPGRGRYAASAAAAALGAAIPVGGLGWSHASRLGVTRVSTAWQSAPGLVAALGWGVAASAGPLFWTLAAAGLATAARRDSASRAWALAGGGILVLACLLMSGPRIFLGGHSMPGPFALFVASPLRFFRAPWRFVVLAGFGGALLAGAALDAAHRTFGGRAGALVAFAVAAAVMAGSRIDRFGLDVIDGQVNPVYDEVARATRARGSGPLLELPIDKGRDALDGSESRVPVGDSMVGATRHGLPLVWGFTGYPATHEPILRRRIGDLDRPGTLADLVDMTHVRWILLRPAGDWADPGQRERIRRLPGTEIVASRDGWDLLRVGLEPRRPDFFAAIAAGSRAGFTPLGSPVDGPRELVADVRVEARPRRVAPGGDVHLQVAIENLSKEPWPATDEAGSPAGVSLVLERRRVGESAPQESLIFMLPRDVSPGETLRVPIDLKAPAAAGAWRFTAFPHAASGVRPRLRVESRAGEDQVEVSAGPPDTEADSVPAAPGFRPGAGMEPGGPGSTASEPAPSGASR